MSPAMTAREASTRTCSNYVKGMINMVKKENQPALSVTIYDDFPLFFQIYYEFL